MPLLNIEPVAVQYFSVWCVRGLAAGMETVVVASPKIREKIKASSTVFQVIENQALLFCFFWPGCAKENILNTHIFARFSPKLYTVKTPRDALF